MKEFICTEFDYFNNPIPRGNVNVLDWVLSSQFEDKVKSIRKLEDKDKRKKLKSRLPCITPSGVFSRRNQNGLLEHSGLICMDFDEKDNPCIDDWELAKYELSISPYSMYCGLSVSGKGVFVLIQISEPKNHELHFDSLRDYFGGLGFIADKNCRDVTRLRGASYDNFSLLNLSAKEYRYIKKPITTRRKNIISSKSEGIVALVERCIIQIEKTNVSIADDYHDWFQIGCSLANEFGESGWEYFRILSSKYDKYNERECYNQYRKCLMNCDKSSIGSFFWYCKKYNITYMR